jgi:phosphoglycolate phosphatase-like HAD superfamily hydrolase
VEPHASESGLSPQADARSLEAGLKALWDRARRAAELIGQLREDKRALAARVTALEGEVRALRDEMAKREQAHERDNGEARARAFTNGEEWDALAAKVKELLAKLDSYL